MSYNSKNIRAVTEIFSVQVDRTFLKVPAKILMTVARIGDNYATINTIGDNFKRFRQEMPNEGPILNSNKRLYRQSLNKKFDTHDEKSMALKTVPI